MAIFNAVQAAAAQGREVTLAALVDFDFPGYRLRTWSGSGVLVVDGVEWHGAGQMGSISAIPFGENDSADKITFTLSGVEPQLVTQVNNSDAVRGRDVTVYGQFFDNTTHQPLDGKFVIRSMIMDTIGYSASGPSERTISLTAETIWTARNLASYSYWSDRDQKARYPGDRGCEFIPTLKNKVVAWPTY
ncbi:hypothetical protein [Aureimonas frigidaquae]|uniref:hypothetical protein n=1 Tax=Aureimonas frigidaquae TaxID=424757 RepID=UPI00078182BB|nr:hypothetical protein [Aureimonas frigidaquae]